MRLEEEKKYPTFCPPTFPLAATYFRNTRRKEHAPNEASQRDLQPRQVRQGFTHGHSFLPRSGPFHPTMEETNISCPHLTRYGGGGELFHMPWADQFTFSKNVTLKWRQPAPIIRATSLPYVLSTTLPLYGKKTFSTSHHNYRVPNFSTSTRSLASPFSFLLFLDVFKKGGATQFTICGSGLAAIPPLYILHPTTGWGSINSYISRKEKKKNSKVFGWSPFQINRIGECSCEIRERKQKERKKR